ncbi:hypothetical protein M5K25_015480 [Dendrobium thyrsiflorum]|uniref:Uncharacterized protein n=1 Tax=Dendrobium thyrsiflorum TaxID=117978 RepID=A0ABD0UQC6_DENTH
MMPNQAYIRVGSIGSGGGSAAVANGGSGTPSPPASPRRSPRMHRRGAKDGGGFGGRRLPPGAPRTLAQRLAWMLLSLLLRRQAIFLFAPLIYVSGMLLYMGTVSLDSVPAIISRPAPGSLYRSPQLYERLRADMDADNSSDGFSDFTPMGRSSSSRRRLHEWLIPERDHGFVYDDQGQTDLLQSTFFDVNLEVDDTVDEYIDRIIFTLAPAIEEHLPTGHWRVIGRPSTSPPPATSPTNNTIGNQESTPPIGQAFDIHLRASCTERWQMSGNMLTEVMVGDPA